MIVLDENIPESQRRLLRRWRIRAAQVGRDLARPGTSDEAILPLLQRLSRVTFFTRDLRFYHPSHRHRSYCLVTLAVSEEEAASFVRRVVRHPTLNTQAKRMGTVIRVTHSGFRLWRLGAQVEAKVSWERKPRPR